MIDLTPLDVRKKGADFKKALRGYDAQEVDSFLEIVAERMEALVRENIGLRERAEALQHQVASWSGRERAVQEALVTAQELRAEMKTQAQRQAELVLAEAQGEARRQLSGAEAEVRLRYREAETKLEQARDALEELERRRNRFLRSFRQLLEREMDVVVVEEGRPPLEERPIDLDLGGGRTPAAAPPADGTDPGEEGRIPPDASVDELSSLYRVQGVDLFGDLPPSAPGDRG
jgi:DivIVA domain-containing protein